MKFLLKFISCLLVSGCAVWGRADDARFDLNGPHIDVYVTRGHTTLPIAQVPNLLANDLLRIKADLPTTQSNHLLLIVVFLRDATNEPPNDWFTKIETWKPTPADGTVIVVPEGAERALLFVAPETGGDFSTLRLAVKGNPGTFIRASESLNKASMEQQRIEGYLAGMQSVAQEDVKVIASRSAKLASSLALKPRAECFKQPVEAQVDCLTQTDNPLLLDDGHGQTVADAISSGASSSFINEASTTDGGVYSPYVGTLVDLVHMVELLHTAQYRYIPAISFPRGPTLNLKLNAAPSFNNPKSVIVIALPAIQTSRFPSVQVANPAQVFCLENPAMTMPLRGSPLAFSTGFAHDLTLDVQRGDATVHLGVAADALGGGLVVREGVGRSPMRRTDGNTKPLQGTLRGYWGFDHFDGPTLTLQEADGGPWNVGGSDRLISGSKAQLTLQGDVGCISKVTLVNDAGVWQPLALSSAVRTGSVTSLPLDVSLKGYAPGRYSLVVEQYGGAKPVLVPLTAYDGSVHFDHVVAHPQNKTALLIGRGVENVVSVEIAGALFMPFGPGGDNNSLQLRTDGTREATPGVNAVVKLKNGRMLTVAVVTEEASADLRLLSFQVTPTERKDALEVVLIDKNDLPLHGTLRFAVQSVGVFPRTQTIEVATVDGAARSIVSASSSNLILQDEHTAVGEVDLVKTLGESAFGVLRLRAVPADGKPGEWVTLGRLVRMPVINGVRCSNVEMPTCMIEGSNLFLADSFSVAENFDGAVSVPSGFDESSFAIPMKTSPGGAMLYVRLRDDPEASAVVRVPDRVGKP